MGRTSQATRGVYGQPSILESGPWSSAVRDNGKCNVTSPFQMSQKQGTPESAYRGDIAKGPHLRSHCSWAG